jgi:hypothetical protein
VALEFELVALVEVLSIGLALNRLFGLSSALGKGGKDGIRNWMCGLVLNEKVFVLENLSLRMSLLEEVLPLLY